MATLVASIVATSVAVRGPGAVRRHVNRPVRAAHRAPATTAIRGRRAMVATAGHLDTQPKRSR